MILFNKILIVGFLKGLHLDPCYFLFISMILGIALTNLQQVILPMILVSCTLIKTLSHLKLFQTLS